MSGNPKLSKLTFFCIPGSHCSNPNYKSFQEIADATSGQVLSLSDHQELQQLTGFTGSVLGGSNVISSGSNISYRKKRRAVRGLRRTRKKGRPMGRMPLGGGGRSKKRGYGLRRVPVRPRTTNKPIKKSQSDYRYSIKIDDSIEKISICITTTQPNQGSTITLTNPGGERRNNRILKTVLMISTIIIAIIIITNNYYHHYHSSSILLISVTNSTTIKSS